VSDSWKHVDLEWSTFICRAFCTQLIVAVIDAV